MNILKNVNGSSKKESQKSLIFKNGDSIKYEFKRYAHLLKIYW
jgi:hypothetical protein